MMKKLIITAIILISLCSGVYSLDYTTAPSPYFVHDMEVFFFEFYDSMMTSKNPFKLGGNAILAAQRYLAGLLLEVPIYSDNANTSVSVMGGYAFQAAGDGKGDLNFLSNNNIAASHIGALTWYGSNHFIRVGYIYGAYTLDDDGVYLKNGVPTYFTSNDRYFNYHTRELDDSNGANRLYDDPDITYHRALFELDWDIGALVLRSLVATSLRTAPAFSRTGLDFSFAANQYSIMPYFCSTLDVEGIEKFSIYQVGVYQKIVSSRIASRSSMIFRSPMRTFGDVLELWQVHLDANYSHIPDTDVAEGRNDYFVRFELIVAMLSASCWWNQDAGIGTGGGVNFYLDDNTRIWYTFKYNSYVSLPLYQRAITDKGYSFEWGCTVSIK